MGRHGHRGLWRHAVFAFGPVRGGLLEAQLHALGISLVCNASFVYECNWRPLGP